MRVFVTGGAGYIGSHTVRQLKHAGHDVLVYDNLSTGRESSIAGIPLVVADMGDEATLTRTMCDFAPDAVIHFAAKIQVEESTQKPLMYYRNNTAYAMNLLAAIEKAGNPHLVFSSTAAVYGEPEKSPVQETTPTAPINPYGMSKLMTERVITDTSRATGGKFAILRYFNVAGAMPDASLGLYSENPTHLIVRFVKAACGVLPGISIFGTDYPTPDGTCIRDYIHVMDLASAHLAALNYLAAGGDSDIFNLGYGHGFSVKEVIDKGQELLDRPVAVTYGPRRAGDAPELVADSSKARTKLGWTPEYNDLGTIIRHALEWERTLHIKA